MLEQLRDGKIGRLPVWAIGVILAAAIIIFMVIRNRMRASGGSDTPAEGDPESVTGIPTQDFADQIGGNFPSTPQPNPITNRPTTNSQWLTRAFDYLVGLAKDPALVQRALQKYLAGRPLTSEEQQVVNQAIANSAISLPPEGVTLPLPSTPPPRPLPPASERFVWRVPQRPQQFGPDD